MAHAERALALTAGLRQGAQRLRPAHRHLPEHPVRAGRDADRARAARSYIDQCILALNAGELTADEAAGAKYWTTDLQAEVARRSAVQLHGGYGFMAEYEVARLWRDARVSASTAAPTRS